jgi:uncharacterized protein (TIGR03437 family)
MCRVLQSILFAIALIAAVPQRAFPQAAVNVASFANPNLPNGSLAQGGMFTVFGSNLGPATLVQSGSFPLPTSLAGTSIQATVGGTTVDCIMIFTAAGQVAGILPSTTPLGQGTMRVTYNGVATTPFPITVVAHSFGTFGINSAGSGPGVLTNAITVAVNTISNSARPGELWDIWGTGLGRAPFPDAQAPLVQDLRSQGGGYTVQVIVGGQQAQVAYAGRSGCCSGVDQIRFTVPQNVSGCYVPVYLVVGGVPSNFTSMSISPTGGACSDPGGLTPEALSDGTLTYGVISLGRTTSTSSFPNIPGVPQSTTQVTESASASYYGYSQDLAIRQSLNGSVFTQGACTVYQFTGQQGDYKDPIQPVGLDAGPSTTISGPGGSRTLNRTDPGLYIHNFPTPGFPFAAQKEFVRNLGVQTIRAALEGGAEQGTTQFFTAGTYTYSAPGGANVGAHSKAITLGEPFNWTNRDQITAITRANGQTVTWTPFSGETMISGSSIAEIPNTDDFYGAGFFCLANGSAGSFNIPAGVLQALPVSTSLSEGGFTFEFGSLLVGLSKNEQCQATGLDLCLVNYSDLSSKSVGYR